MSRKRTPDEQPAEASTAVACLVAGGDLLILRHPEAVCAVKKTIAELTGALAGAAVA